MTFMRIIEIGTAIEVELNKETIETYYSDKNEIYITTITGRKYRYLDDTSQFVRDFDDTDNSTYRFEALSMSIKPKRRA